MPGAVRLGFVLAVVLAMLFGLRPEPSNPTVLGLGAVAADANDHANRQHEWPAGAVELVAEAEESRDELEERSDAPPPAGLLGAGAHALVSMHPVAFGATWWVGRPRLGGAGGLGRGPPTRA